MISILFSVLFWLKWKLLYASLSQAVVYGCEYQQLPAIEIEHVYVEPTHGRARRQIDIPAHHNLRIFLHYDNSVQSIPEERQDLLKDKVISQAINYWEKALKTRRLTKPLKLARTCQQRKQVFNMGLDEVAARQPYCDYGCTSTSKCGEVTIPEEHLKGCRVHNASSNTFEEELSSHPGVDDADFILYVAASNTARCNSSIAYASYCQQEVEYDRPIAGFINICPQGLSTHEAQYKLAVSTVKHEILHALGFSLNLYGFYRDSDGNPLTPRLPPDNKPRLSPSQTYEYSEKVIRTFTRANWMSSEGVTDRIVHVMVTPNVVREVRQHFNCSTLHGADMENQGPAGTVLTHWEKRLFENELMTGIYTQNPVVSRVTLALMQDTGWYMADYSQAERLEWGSGLGCDFVTKSCYEWITTKQKLGLPVLPYCVEVKSDILKTQCTRQRTAVSLCNVHEYSEALPPVYRVFSLNSKLGGMVGLADYCPYLQEFNWNIDGRFERGSDCTLPVNMPGPDSNFAAEAYGPDSKCFDQTSPFKMSRCKETYDSNNYGSGCYKYTCTNESGLTIYVSDKPYRCYEKDQLLSIAVTSKHSYHEGTIRCPDCLEVCQGVSTCPVESAPPAVSEASTPDIPCTAIFIHQHIWLARLLLLTHLF